MRTYDVVPVKRALGLVAFVPGTVPLRSVIAQPALVGADAIRAGDNAFCRSVLEGAGAAVGEVAPTPQHYKAMLRRCQRDAAIAGLHKAEACVRWDALRYEFGFVGADVTLYH